MGGCPIEEPTVSPSRPALPTILLLALLASGAASAGETAPAGMADETMVVARSVMPRIAYRGLEPTANPVRVEATVFPGRVFNGVVGTLVERLAGDDELADRAPLQRPGVTAMRGTGVDMLGTGVGLQGAGPSASTRTGGSIGSMVSAATAGIGDRVTQAMQRATGAGVGP